jgi:hypothetical protein
MKPREYGQCDVVVVGADGVRRLVDGPESRDSRGSASGVERNLLLLGAGRPSVAQAARAP